MGRAFWIRDDRSALELRLLALRLADITWIATDEGRLHPATVLDLFTREVVGWAMRDHLRREPAIAALTMAFQRQRPAGGSIHHSDRASRYAAGDYRELLQAHGMIPSVSRKSNRRDNAPMESWFHTPKTEVVRPDPAYATRDAAGRDLSADIETHYKRRPLHSALGYRTPDQAELQAA